MEKKIAYLVCHCDTKSSEWHPFQKMKVFNDYDSGVEYIKKKMGDDFCDDFYNSKEDFWEIFIVDYYEKTNKNENVGNQ